MLETKVLSTSTQNLALCPGACNFFFNVVEIFSHEFLTFFPLVPRQNCQILKDTPHLNPLQSVRKKKPQHIERETRKQTFYW